LIKKKLRIKIRNHNIEGRTLNIYIKNTKLKGKIKKEKSNSQNNPKQKTQAKRNNFQRTQWWWMKVLKIIKNDWSQLCPTLSISETNHEAGSQCKRQAQKINNVKF
jgi:hypothetical protein